MSDKIEKPEEKALSAEETFEQMKQVFVMTCEQNVENALRIDNLLNIRDLAYRFWGDKLDEWHDSKERVKYYKELMEVSVNAYQAILDRAKTFEFEEFAKEEMKDYFDDITPKPEDIETDQDLLDAMIVFLSIRPYGERMLQLHRTIRDMVPPEED